MTNEQKKAQVANQARLINEMARAKRAFPWSWPTKDAMERDLATMRAELERLKLLPAT